MMCSVHNTIFAMVVVKEYLASTYCCAPQTADPFTHNTTVCDSESTQHETTLVAHTYLLELLHIDIGGSAVLLD